MRKSRKRGRGRRAALATAALATTLVSAVAALSSAGPAARADTSLTLPPVRHVFVVNLENFSFRDTFNASGKPERAYLATLLRQQGVLLENYYGIGHNSLGNYIAEISGQAPNPSTQSDCLSYTDVNPGQPLDSHGQAPGNGCIYPKTVKTLADQLQSKSLAWKGYNQDLGLDPAKDGGFRCGHAPVGGTDFTANANNPDKYVTKHNPFAFFHTLIDDDPSCREHNAPLEELFSDLQRIDTTPNFSMIAPNTCDDGHDGNCSNGYSFDGRNDSGLSDANRFMAWLVPKIMASPAYRQDGMLIVTFDEASTALGVSGDPDDTAACCNEIPGPGSPMPGVQGQGGGKTGTLIFSPYIAPGSSAATGTSGKAPDAYNHYSLLRSLEDLFGIATGGTDGQGHLGFAAAGGAEYPGPGSFGQDVYNHVPGTGTPAIPGSVVGLAPRDATPGQQPVGPRATSPGVTDEGPSPTDADLNGVDCPGADVCMAVGDAGVAVRRDSGGSWTASRTATAHDLLDVACTGPQDCVAVGEAGLALITHDAGQTWTSGETSNDQTLRGVACPSAQVCYAVGDEGTLERSDDGGLAWVGLDSGVLEPLMRIDCPDASHCAATGGERRPVDLFTSDGGVSWASVAAVYNGTRGTEAGTGVSCSSVGHCTISGPGSASRSTTDAGANWTRSRWEGSRLVGGAQVNLDNRFLGVDCVSDSLCYMASDNAGVFKIDVGTATTNPSETGWKTTMLTPSADIGDDLRDISCPGQTRCVAVGDHGQILASTDGATWSSERTGLLPKAPGEPSDSAVAILRGADCLDSGACVAVGDEGSVATKAGAGAGWVGRSSGLLDADRRATPLYGVSCRDNGTCVAVGTYDTILRSTDAGATWSKSVSPALTRGPLVPNQQELRAVSCFTDSDCVAVGAFGRVIRSLNGGLTWTELGAQTPYSLNGVSCTATGHCVAVGEVGRILRSTDGGATWADVDSGTLAYLAGISCPDDSQCVSVGQSGLALVSTDGGQTWDRSPTDVDDSLASVDCPSVNQCTAAGSSGTLLSTADFGDSWTVFGTGTARALNGAACATTLVCYGVGEWAEVIAVGASAAASAPRIGAGDVTTPEGNSGVHNATVTVTLDHAPGSGEEVDVSYATQSTTGPGAATRRDDYLPVSGHLHFGPGQAEKTLSVPIVGDTAVEGDETLAVALSDPDGAFLDRSLATVTIVDDELLHGVKTSPPGGGTDSTQTSCRPAKPITQVLRNTIRVSRAGLTVSGRAVALGCSSDRVTDVGVAVARLAKGRCRFLNRLGRFTGRRSCNRKLFLSARTRYSAAQGATLWTFGRRARLPRGTYRIFTRGRARQGGLEAARAPVLARAR